MSSKLLKYKWYIAITGLIVLNIARYGYQNYLLDKEITIHSTEVYAQKSLAEEVSKDETIYAVDNKDIIDNEAMKEMSLNKEDIKINEKIDEEKEENVARNSEKIPIYICGAVQNPGVYYVSKGCIVNDVVELSGGLTAEADLMAIHLAKAIQENEKIIIPKVGEEIDKFSNLYENDKETEKLQATELSTQQVINLNTATKKELMSLNGIGDVKADAILNYRMENKAFQSIEDIKNVSGIGEKTFENIKSFITI